MTSNRANSSPRRVPSYFAGGSKSYGLGGAHRRRPPLIPNALLPYSLPPTLTTAATTYSPKTTMPTDRSPLGPARHRGLALCRLLYVLGRYCCVTHIIIHSVTSSYVVSHHPLYMLALVCAWKPLLFLRIARVSVLAQFRVQVLGLRV